VQQRVVRISASRRTRAGHPDAYTTSLAPPATLLLSENVNPKIVQEILEHATISQTMDTYSHVLPDMQDQAVLAMENTLAH
jgi:integrase